MLNANATQLRHRAFLFFQDGIKDGRGPSLDVCLILASKDRPRSGRIKNNYNGRRPIPYVFK